MAAKPLIYFSLLWIQNLMKIEKGVPMMGTTRSNHQLLDYLKKISRVPQTTNLALCLIFFQKMLKIFRSIFKYAVLVKPDPVIEGLLLLRSYSKWLLMWVVWMSWCEKKKENSWRREKFIQSCFSNMISAQWSCRRSSQ